MQDQDYYRDLEQLERRVFERCLRRRIPVKQAPASD